MVSESAYLEAVKNYTDGVRIIYTTPGKPAGVRGMHGAASYEELAVQSKSLDTHSAQLTKIAAERLEDPSAQKKEDISISMLGKVHTDLDVGFYLLDAAREREMKIEFAKRDSDQSRASTASANEQLLRMIEGIYTGQQENNRSATTFNNLKSARGELVKHSDLTLTMINNRAGKACESAFTGLIGLGVAELLQAANLVGLDIAGKLGKAQQVGELFDQFRNFFGQAYDSISVLLGPQMIKVAGDEVLDWLEKFKTVKNASMLLGKFYEIESIRSDTTLVIKNSQVSLENFTAGLTAVKGLNDSFQKQTKLVNSILPKMKYAALIPAAILPQGKLIAAAAYIGLGAYTAYAAGDYMDAERLHFFDRVFGLQQVINSKLG